MKYILQAWEKYSCINYNNKIKFQKKKLNYLYVQNEILHIIVCVRFFSDKLRRKWLVLLVIITLKKLN